MSPLLSFYNISIVSLKLCMDDITDAGYWKYMNATPFQKAQMQLKFFVMYLRVFEEGESQYVTHMSYL